MYWMRQGSSIEPKLPVVSIADAWGRRLVRVPRNTSYHSGRARLRIRSVR